MNDRGCSYIFPDTFSMKLNLNFKMKALVATNFNRVQLSSAAIKLFFALKWHWKINSELNAIFLCCSKRNIPIKLIKIYFEKYSF